MDQDSRPERANQRRRESARSARSALVRPRPRIITVKIDPDKVCPVTGGLGTMAVSHAGKTYYVCCTGCREAFDKDPERYVGKK